MEQRQALRQSLSRTDLLMINHIYLHQVLTADGIHTRL